MRVSYLISGFPVGFTDEFIESVKDFYCEVGDFVFIASDFEGYELSDKYSSVFIKMFEDKGVKFNRISIIDYRVTIDDAHKMIGNASVVWITGGDTLKQIKYLEEYKIKESLLKRIGITIGISAGAINMAKRVVLAKDLRENIPSLSV